MTSHQWDFILCCLVIWHWNWWASLLICNSSRCIMVSSKCSKRPMGSSQICLSSSVNTHSFEVTWWSLITCPVSCIDLFDTWTTQLEVRPLIPFTLSHSTHLVRNELLLSVRSVYGVCCMNLICICDYLHLLVRSVLPWRLVQSHFYVKVRLSDLSTVCYFVEVEAYLS